MLSWWWWREDFTSLNRIQIECDNDGSRAMCLEFNALLIFIHMLCLLFILDSFFLFEIWVCLLHPVCFYAQKKYERETFVCVCVCVCLLCHLFAVEIFSLPCVRVEVHTSWQTSSWCDRFKNSRLKKKTQNLLLWKCNGKKMKECVSRKLVWRITSFIYRKRRVAH